MSLKDIYIGIRLVYITDRVVRDVNILLLLCVITIIIMYCNVDYAYALEFSNFKEFKADEDLIKYFGNRFPKNSNGSAFHKFGILSMDGIEMYIQVNNVQEAEKLIESLKECKKTESLLVFKEKLEAAAHKMVTEMPLIDRPRMLDYIGHQYEFRSKPMIDDRGNFIGLTYEKSMTWPSPAMLINEMRIGHDKLMEMMCKEYLLKQCNSPVLIQDITSYSLKCPIQYFGNRRTW